MRKPILLAIVCAAAMLGLTTGATRAEWRVWTTNQTRRVLRDDPAEEGLAVHLAAARNEWESFQVLMRSDQPIKDINVVPADLVGPEGAVLPAADARLFRQHQFHIETASNRNDQFRPGWYPDALIPFVHPLTGKPLHGARFTAVPFDLPAKQTHGFWVDIHVPADARPGLYRGTYRATGDGGRTVAIPVDLTIWDFELPATPTMRTAFSSPLGRMRLYYQRRAERQQEKWPSNWSDIEVQCRQMIADHRINVTPDFDFSPVAQPDGSFRVPDALVRALRAFVDRYHVNVVSVAQPKSVIADPDREQGKLRAWLASIDRAAKQLDRPQVLFYTYLQDEPNSLQEYQFVQKWGPIVREANSVVKVMVTEQPQPSGNGQWGNLYGAVDIWCPLFSLFEPGPAAQRQALGETIWTYTALCQGDKKSPWWETDFPLLHYRVPAWIMWRYRIRGLLYWGGMAYWDELDDPWTQPRTMGKEADGYNGEGLLVYPGRAVGYDGLAPSLRLKALRDSIEDYEYLAMAERLGLAAEAEKIVLPLAGSWFQWDHDPAAYEIARAKLAKMLVETKNK